MVRRDSGLVRSREWRACRSPMRATPPRRAGQTGWVCCRAFPLCGAQQGREEETESTREDYETSPAVGQDEPTAGRAGFQLSYLATEAEPHQSVPTARKAQ